MRYLMMLLALVVATSTISGQSAATNPLVGAWKVESAQPGLYIFTKQHYSFARIQGDKPLPVYPSNGNATAADKTNVFNALYLNTGTYMVTGNKLATRVMVAKSKFAISGAGNQRQFPLSGNSFTLT